MTRAPVRMASPSHNRVRFTVSSSRLPRVRCWFFALAGLLRCLLSFLLDALPSLLLFLLSPTLSSRFPPAMSDTPPLRDFLQAVFARIKAGGTGDSELAVWRNTARELVDRTIGVSSGCVAHSVG